ncbi:hypothetical protein RDI58_001275 [Solanum bulbocastanum]|uniref:Uncharacterized protein n=1 Tax=Solanum bulbocastanum TaxID=147425 RepID=A0AAN8YQ15_SOLBU
MKEGRISKRKNPKIYFDPPKNSSLPKKIRSSSSLPTSTSLTKSHSFFSIFRQTATKQSQTFPFFFLRPKPAGEAQRNQLTRPITPSILFPFLASTPLKPSNQ